MSSTVTLPLWLALIIGALAIWAAFERIVVPAVRYLMRRRLNRAIDELNTKLKLRIQPLKLAKRQALIDQLIFDPEVLRAVEAYAAEHKVSREVAQAKARDYAKEIVPSFSAYAYFGIGIRMARWLSTFLYRVRLGYLDEQAMQRQLRTSPLRAPRAERRPPSARLRRPVFSSCKRVPRSPPGRRGGPANI